MEVTRQCLEDIERLENAVVKDLDTVPTTVCTPNARLAAAFGAVLEPEMGCRACLRKCFDAKRRRPCEPESQQSPLHRR